MPEGPSTDTHHRILAAGRDVLARFTVAKFAMEDVAKAAGVARQTVYKYFASRDDLLIAIFIQEMLEHHAPALAEKFAADPSPDALLDLFMAELSAARAFPLFAEVLHPDMAPRMAELVFGSEKMTRVRAEIWIPTLERHEVAGVIRPGMDHVATTRWITYQEFWLLTHPNTLCPDDEIEYYVRNYIIAGLLSPAHAAEWLQTPAPRS